MKKILITTLIFLSLLIISGITILNKSLSPLKEAEAETIQLAKQEADLINADDFYWYNGNETYFTVTGKNNENEAIIVIVKQEDQAVEILNEEDVLSKAEVIKKVIELENPARILEARIGMHEDQPIWEVSFRQENERIGYAMFSLSTGEWIRTIKNI